MKKWLKIILNIIEIIVLLIALDLISVYIVNKPIFTIKGDNGDSIDTIYKGPLYDVVICHESSKPQIILKGYSYSCSYKGGNYKLVDKTEEIEDFVCAAALEKFYEDDNYTYYWSCMKNNYMVVKYNDGNEETISDALIKKHINIQILDKFDIKYIKSEK
ncbi:MAG: hypothetical protein E7167_03530 [Firmicutes bacterium]|nr:hypothetical protein [Bacillota bacterium]